MTAIDFIQSKFFRTVYTGRMDKATTRQSHQLALVVTPGLHTWSRLGLGHEAITFGRRRKAAYPSHSVLRAFLCERT
jgi:hypothetical protein